jgi:hypothetical protein
MRAIWTVNSYNLQVQALRALPGNFGSFKSFRTNVNLFYLDFEDLTTMNLYI